MAPLLFDFLMPPGTEAELAARYNFRPKCIVIKDFDRTITIRIEEIQLATPNDGRNKADDTDAQPEPEIVRHRTSTAIGDLSVYLDLVESKLSPGDYLSPQQFADTAELETLEFLFSTRDRDPDDVIAEVIGEHARMPILSWNEAAVDFMSEPHNDEEQGVIDEDDPAYFIKAWKDVCVTVVGRFVKRRFGMGLMWIDNEAEGTRVHNDPEMKVVVVPVEHDKGITKDTVRHMRGVIETLPKPDSAERWPTAWEILMELQELHLLHQALRDARELDPTLEPASPEGRLQKAYGEGFDLTGESRDTELGTEDLRGDEIVPAAELLEEADTVTRTPGQMFAALRDGSYSVEDPGPIGVADTGVAATDTALATPAAPPTRSEPARPQNMGLA